MLMQERVRTERIPDSVAMVDEAVVEARELYKAYGAKVAVDGVSFAVRRGEIFGILGPNGAGKSTTLELLEGLRDPDRGAAIIDGLEVRRNKRAAHALIGDGVAERQHGITAALDGALATRGFGWDGGSGWRRVKTRWA